VDGRDEAIVPSDVALINDDQLLTIFSQSKCLTYLIFDCCHSGSICDLQWRFEYVPRNKNYLRSNENKRVLSNKNIIMISGCRDNQTSADAYNIETRMAMGAMTNALIDSIRANDYNATFLKIYADMCVWLKNKRHTQFPCLSSSNPSPTAFKLTRQPSRKRDLQQQQQPQSTSNKVLQSSMRGLMYK
jgi:hypothetical protein